MNIIKKGVGIKVESIMLQNLFIMLFGISQIFCLLCSFLCFLGMCYADNLYANQKHLGCKKRRGQSEAAVI